MKTGRLTFLFRRTYAEERRLEILENVTVAVIDSA